MIKHEWKQEYSVGNAEMDRHHQSWLNIVATYEAAVESHDANRSFTRFIEASLDFADFHFHAEETILEQHDYPLLTEHRASHQKFREMLDLLLDDKEYHPDQQTREKVERFLLAWLPNHIIREDKLYQPYLQQSAVSA